MLTTQLTHGPEGMVTRMLHTLVAKVPRSTERPAPEPRALSRRLAKHAALRAATLSGTMTLPPGPLGLATVVPDLLAVWRLQQQLVADIAAAFGKTDVLTSEAMILSLFQHTDDTLSPELLARSGNRVLLRRIASTTLHQLLGKIGIRVTRNLARKGFSRWLPLVGALGVGAYAYYETMQIAVNAIELFADLESIEVPAPARAARRKARTTRRKKGPTRKKISRRSSAQPGTRRHHGAPA